MGCAVGPDYHKPAVQIPESFKEGVDWQRAQANPQGSLSSTWWLDYHDEQLSKLVDAALQANQSIIAAEAAYRVAQATVSASVAALYPTVSASVSGTRAEYGSAASAAHNGPPGVYHYVTASAAASWELDLWGKTRRQIESSKASAQASDAQRAGQRLSIAASVASDYFALRQADIDIDFLKQQQQVYGDILAMTQAGYAQGGSSGDDVLIAQDTLEAVIAALQTTQTQREQYEHALAVLVGVPPGGFSIEPRKDYVFVTPAVPLSLPSQLLERRYDVVTAERQAASANAKIGVAKAAFYPTLDLAAQGGYVHNQFAHLFSLPNRFWTLGPTLAETIFDGGARSGRGARSSRDLRRRRGQLPADRADGVSERRRQRFVVESSAAAGSGLHQHLSAHPEAVRQHARTTGGRYGEPAKSAERAAHAAVGKTESAGQPSLAHSEQRDIDQEPGWGLAVG